MSKQDQQVIREDDQPSSGRVVEINRRAFLGVVGAATGGAVLATAPQALAAPSADSSSYTLSNDYLTVSGSYGAFTSIAVDPTGSGNYRDPSTFTRAFVGQNDVFDQDHNSQVTSSINGNTLQVANIQIPGTPAQSAQIDVMLSGPRLELTYTLSSADGSNVGDPGFSLVTSWLRDGYSIAYDDGVLFSRFATDTGQLMPAQQLKRRPSWGTFGLGPANSLIATGTGDYDVIISTPSIAVNGSSPIDTDQMSLQLLGTQAAAATISNQLIIEVRPHTDRLPDTFPAFTASDQATAADLTTFLLERTMSAQQGATATNGGDWKDWTGRMYDWTPGGFREGERDNLLSITLDDDGYVWTWNPANTREWPFPDGPDWDSRHFTTNPMYVLGAWRYYSWTGDREFLATILPRVRSALGFLRTSLGGDSGLVTLPGPDHDGRPGSIGSNYWDITPFGNLDAYTNLYFCACLEPAAQLEDAVGAPERAADLRRLAASARQRFSGTFFDEQVGRFIECVDVAGTRHDYGSAFVNLEAMSFGLATDKQAARIYNWLERNPTELTNTILLLTGGSDPPATASAGHTLGQSFTSDAPFAQVGLSLAAADPTAADSVTVTLRRGGPGGTLVGTATQPWRGGGGWMPLTVPTQDPGSYYVELSVDGLVWASGPAYDGGSAFADGQVDSSVASRAIAVVSPYDDGPADTYSRFGWAPRTTTRRNNFWYYWGWAGITVPFEQQLQDGGTDLYLSGFDVQARARYFGGDNAWKRLLQVVGRWRDPDHLCGGDPLYRGEHPQNEINAGSVGVDIPFPESGLAPNSFLEAILGVVPEPDALTVTPRLPRTLSSAGVQRMMWQGRTCELTVTQREVRLQARGLNVSIPYRPGETVRIPTP